MNAPILEGDDLRLVPLDLDVLDEMHTLGDDPEVLRFTYVSAPFTRDDATAWIQRYIDGWAEGTRAGFSIQSSDGKFQGFMAVIRIEDDERQGEIGYIVAPRARGRGVASEALKLITDWSLGDLGLERVELRMSSENVGSAGVAKRAGYTYEGTLRSLHFKEGRRGDTAVYSRLPSDA